MAKPKSVDEFIKNAPKEVQHQLHELRKAIKEAALEALEKISYQMPYYHYKGRLVYFNVWRDHFGVYALTSHVIEQFKKELEKNITGKGTLSFPLDKKLPLSLIKKLVKAQVKINDEIKQKKGY